MKPKKPSAFTRRHQITPARLTAFLRAVRETESMMAVKLINERLDEGETVEELFSEKADTSYKLTVKTLGKDRYRVKFGCQPGPDCGDGGEWGVTFSGDTVVSIESGTCWMS